MISTAVLSIRILSHTKAWQELIRPAAVHTPCENSRLSAQSQPMSRGMARITTHRLLWNKADRAGLHFAAAAWAHLACGTARTALLPRDPLVWMCVYVEVSCGRVNSPVQRGDGANERRTACREAQSRLMRCKIQERRAQWRMLPYELFQFSNLSNHGFSLKCRNDTIFKKTRNFYPSLSARYLAEARDCGISWLQGLDRCLYTHVEQALWF